MEKSIADAVADLDVQKGIEADHKRKRELETLWILRAGEMPL